MKKLAVRTIRLCSKDCICLYVCPTGATDTENSIIDIEKCIGCGVCAESCPSKAISMVPVDYPPQQPKNSEVLNAMNSFSESKSKQEIIALQIAKNTDNPILCQLAEAISKSNRIMTEDILRESGYMLPQSGNARSVLKLLLNNPPFEDFPKEVAEKLLILISSTKENNQ